MAGVSFRATPIKNDTHRLTQGGHVATIEPHTAQMLPTTGHFLPYQGRARRPVDGIIRVYQEHRVLWIAHRKGPKSLL